jgi:hypothetical protein
MKKVVGLTALAAVLTAPFVLAQTAPNELNAKDIIAKLESAGYTQIHDVEKDDGIWEVEATNSAGKRVELDVDPVSGNVVREDPDDQNDDWD